MERAPRQASRQHYAHPLDLVSGRVQISHGGGGRATAQLIDELFLPLLGNEWLRAQNDQAAFGVEAGRMVVSTDCHVVSPLIFPGGDIGALSVHGTINDVAMSGAWPRYLTAGFVLEEGLELAVLREVVASMAKAAEAAQVPIVAGDTKVVERGKGDGLYITTTGIGTVPPGIAIAADRAQPGDAILLSGSIGDHGVAVMSQRSGLTFDTAVLSDSAALHELVAAMVAVVPAIHCLRDPTRGGLGTALNELAHQSAVGIEIAEAAIVVREPVRALCEILGLDPLYVANEGKLVAICPPAEAEALLGAMRRHPLGSEAAIIGRVVADDRHFVQMKTAVGGSRIIDWLSGDQLPRIC